MMNKELISIDTYKAMGSEERVDYNLAQNDEVLREMYRLEYISESMLFNLLEERGTLTIEEQDKKDTKHRKMARLLGQVAANVHAF